LPFSAEEFKRAYASNLVLAAELSVERDEMASALLSWMHTRSRPWTGSMTDLRDELKRVDPELKRSQRRLASDLMRAAPALERLGFNIKRLARKNERRQTLYRISVPDRAE